MDMIIWYTIWIAAFLAVVTAVVGMAKAIYDADRETKAEKIDIPELLREMRAKGNPSPAIS